MSSSALGTERSKNLRRKDLAKVNKKPKLIEDKYGGMENFANALGSDLGKGLTRDVIHQREKYGSNNPKKSLVCLALKAILYRDIVITAACGMVILGVGIPAEGFSEAKEGGSILVAVVIAAFIILMKEWWSNKLLVSLHDVIDSAKISVVRSGENQQVPVSDIVVGDVILLKSRDRVPGHGFLIDQDSLKLDLPMDYSMNPLLLLSGTWVVAGSGRMLVTAVGVNESRRSLGKNKNLQSQLEAVVSLIQILVYLLIVLFIRSKISSLFFTHTDESRTEASTYTDESGTKASPKGIDKAYPIIKTLVLIRLTAIHIPNTWQLSLMLTKAYATWKLKAGKIAKVFDPSALESMSYAKVICTDKTGVIGVSNTCSEEVKKAVSNCRTAGVKLKLITEDDLSTAKAIARECGILGEQEEEQQVIEGTEFRNYSEEERIQKVDSIGVVANASRWDKHLMIQSLKRKGDVVAVAGELPTSEDADITVSMEVQGAFGADILILDGDFASVVRVLEWGRCFYRSIQKFLQFQLTYKIVTLIVSFTTNFPFTTVQLLWLSVLNDTLAAVAFATLKPTKDIWKSQPVEVAISESQPVEVAISESQPVEAAILESQPVEAAISESQPVETQPVEADISETQPVEADISETQPVEAVIVREDILESHLVTNAMLLNVLLQSLYQIVVLSYFIKGNSGKTFIFNLVVLFRVFSALSARELGAASIFRRLHRNGQFLVIFGVSVALQVLFVEILPKVFDTEQLSWSEWGKCVAIVFVTLPIGWMARSIPVPKTQIFGYCKKILNLKSRIEKTILSEIRSLLIWSLILIGVRKRKQPRGDSNV